MPISAQKEFHAEHGFTLIELMVVIGAIAILSAIALPYYQSYAARAKLAEVVLQAASCRSSVAEVVQNAEPSTVFIAGTWGCESSTPKSTYVAAVATNANGAIRIVIQNIAAAAGSNIVLAPTVPLQSGSAIPEWRCGPGLGSAPALRQLLPSSCRDPGVSDQTDFAP